MRGERRREGRTGVGVTVTLEAVEERHVGLRGLDGDDIGVEGDDVGEDRVKVGVAEVRVSLGRVTDTGSREPERVNGVGEVRVPVDLAEGESLSDCGLVDLDGEDSGGLEVVDLVTEGEGELLALHLTGDVHAREGPVEDGRRSREHSLRRTGD